MADFYRTASSASFTHDNVDLVGINQLTLCRRRRALTSTILCSQCSANCYHPVIHRNSTRRSNISAQPELLRCLAGGSGGNTAASSAAEKQADRRLNI